MRRARWPRDLLLGGVLAAIPAGPLAAQALSRAELTASLNPIQRQAVNSLLAAMPAG